MTHPQLPILVVKIRLTVIHLNLLVIYTQNRSNTLDGIFIIRPTKIGIYVESHITYLTPKKINYLYLTYLMDN